MAKTEGSFSIQCQVIPRVLSTLNPSASANILAASQRRREANLKSFIHLQHMMHLSERLVIAQKCHGLPW